MRRSPELHARHTHLYPGARVHIDAVDTAVGTPLSLVFSDQVCAQGELLAREGLAWLIAVGPYRTAAGSAIAAKRWRLEPLPDDPSLYRVLGRIDKT